MDDGNTHEDGLSPHVARALGPRLAQFVHETPLDQEAADQITAILENPAVEEMRGPMVSVALMNCLERRVSEAEAEIAAYRDLSARIEAAAKA